MTADLHPDTGVPRPGTCCGACPPIAGGGWDCTCAGNPRCSVSAPAAEWDDLARLAEAASPGPWGRDGYAVLGQRRQANAEFIAAANPATILRLIAELRRAKRAAQTLGRVIEQQGRDVLDATGMHHVIGEDGDGDWAVVWEVLADQAVERRQMAARLAAVEAALSNHPRTCEVYPRDQHWCGWKRAVADVETALAPTTEESR